MALLADRKQFRRVLKEVAKCVRTQLDAPGLVPLNAEQIFAWLQNITPDDLEIVMREIEVEGTPGS